MLVALVCVALLAPCSAVRREVPVTQLPTHSVIHAEYVPGEVLPQPDPEDFPLYHKAKPIQYTLKPGDDVVCCVMRLAL